MQCRLYSSSESELHRFRERHLERINDLYRIRMRCACFSDAAN